MKANHGRYGQVELVSQDAENVYILVNGSKQMLNKKLASSFSPLTTDEGEKIDLFSLELPEESKVEFVKPNTCDSKEVKKNSKIRQYVSESEERYTNGYCKTRK